MRLLLWGAVVCLAGATLGAAIGGPHMALAAASGAFGGAVIQWIAGRLLLRVHGADTAAFLLGFSRASMVRVFGGTAFVIAVLAAQWVAPLPFLAGFGAAYLALEVVADVLLVRNESHLDRVV